jgi:antitoxin (DNA-binding transcriptional repressor) of toxin-antitoxin stability system
MIKINIYEAKVNLSKYLKKLKEGESILLCKRNEPVAEIRRIEKSRIKRRPVGLAKGEFEVPASFFDPLPSDIVDSFSGSNS